LYSSLAASKAVLKTAIAAQRQLDVPGRGCHRLGSRQRKNVAEDGNIADLQENVDGGAGAHRAMRRSPLIGGLRRVGGQVVLVAVFVCVQPVMHSGGLLLVRAPE
jgi:hypothetical protein